MDFLDGAAAFRATFSEDERAVAAEAFRRLLGGAPVPLEILATALSLPPARVAFVAARLVERGTLTLGADGAITAAGGVSLAPTPHEVTLAASRFYAFCAVDAVGIPVALGREAQVRSRCHACRAPLALRVAADGRVAAPAGVVIWAADRDPARSLREHT